MPPGLDFANACTLVHLAYPGGNSAYLPCVHICHASCVATDCSLPRPPRWRCRWRDTYCTESLIQIQYIRRSVVPQGGAYPPVSADDDEDLRGAAQEATKRAGESGTEDMFKGILGMLGQKKQQLKDEDDVDEESGCP